MPSNTLVMVLVDLLIIMVAAKTFGRLAEKLGQPAVIGEINAGILSGPAPVPRSVPTDARPVLVPPTSASSRHVRGIVKTCGSVGFRRPPFGWGRPGWSMAAG